ncbi:MAG TPA: ABC transporter ATP-binding protein, partial [Acidimicrobiales bacterium]|nr:ABC transporter ATP-binding protein [Acidimicrobiales bacterium]
MSEADGGPVAVVDRLCADYLREGRWHPVLDDVSLQISPGEILGLAGESGSGKSTLAYALLGYARSGGRVASGSVRIAGQVLGELDAGRLRQLRGGVVGFVSQHPGAALARGLRVKTQLAEMLRHHGWPAPEIAGRCTLLLESVGLPDPATTLHKYPYQLSGGQQQRVAIAMAIACSPRLVVLDEPTTGLDVTTTARVIELLRELRARDGVAMLYVTHDLRVLRRLCDRIGVMHAGALVELGPAAEVLEQPRHPYTVALAEAVPA